MKLETADQIIAQHQQGELLLVPLLLDLQEAYGYLPEAVLRHTAQRLEVPLSRLYGLATFYKALSLEPRGKYCISLCLGTACQVRGTQLVLEEFERRLGIAAGETTDDGKFTLETVNCLGACALGPVATVNGEYHGQLTVASVQKIVEQCS